MTLTGIAPPVGQPLAQRLRRPSWRDPRLLFGLVLLFASAAVGARVVAGSDHTQPVYAARRTLPTGTSLTSGVLEVVHLRLTGTSAGYLDARRPIPVGQVLVRTVGAGEIIPLTSIVPAGRLLSRPVDIPIDGTPPVGLAAGGLVDVWASVKRQESAGGGYEPPERIAQMVEVFDVDRPAGGLSADRAGSVQILLPAQSLAPVLDALANEARVVVLPVPGTVAGHRSSS